MDMTTATLMRALNGSFSAVPEERADSERFITAAELQEGYLQSLVQLWVSDNAEPQIRQSAAIAAKNVIRKFWSRSVQYDLAPIAITPGQGEYVNEIREGDKMFFKTNALEILIRCVNSSTLRPLATECIKQVVHRDYPLNWTQLMDQCMILLRSTDNSEKVSAGLIVARLMAREFEMKSRGNGRQPIELLVSNVLPILLHLGKQLTASNQTSSLLLLRLIMKTFYSCIMYNLSAELAKPDICSAWLELTLNCVKLGDSREPQTDDEAKEKLQKWSLRIMHKFLAKHGNPKSVDEEEGGSSEFAKWWLSNFAPVLTHEVISMMQQKIIASPCNVNIALSFLSEAVQHSVTFKPMKPHLELLLFGVIFPLMCFNEEKKELWEDDPQEFVRCEFDCFAAMTDPRSAAKDFVVSMVNLRSSEVLAPLLKFCELNLEQARQNPTNPEVAIKKDGALGLIAAISSQLCLASSSKKSKKAKSQLPDETALLALLGNFVLPDLQSPFPFLRYRACQVFQSFVIEKLSFKKNKDLLGNAFMGIKMLMADSELPVRVQAGICLREFLVRSELDEIVPNHVPELLDRLLRVMAEVESEELAATLETLVEEYTDEVTPFAAQAIDQLGRQFIRLMDSDDDEASFAATGVIQTICTILDGAGSSPHMFTSIEPYCYPILDKLFRPEGIDYLQEGLEILSALSFFCIEPLSEGLWRYYALLYQSVCGGQLPGFELTGDSANGWAVDYLEDMLNPLDNFVSRGTETFLTGTGPLGLKYTEMLYLIVKRGFETNTDESVNGALRVAACVFESCPAQRINEQFLPYLQIAWAKLKEQKDDICCDRWAMYLFGCMCIADLPALIQASTRLGIADQLLLSFVDNAKAFKNPEERKVLMLAISNVLKSAEDIATAFPAVGARLTQFVEVLALQSKQIIDIRKKIEVARQREDQDSDEASEEDDDYDFEDLKEDEDAASTNQVEMYKKLRETLASLRDNESEEDYDDNASEFSMDDCERTTPLDNIDEFATILNLIHSLNPNTKNSLLGWIPQHDLIAWVQLLETNKRK